MKTIDELLAELMAGFTLAEPGEQEAEDRRHRATELREVRDRLPPVFRFATATVLGARVANTPAGQQLLKAASAWRPGAGNLLLLGPTGVGKSTVAAVLFRRLLGAGIREGGAAFRLAESLHWYSAESLSLARRLHPLGQGEPPDVMSAMHGQFLVLDDLGWDRDVQAVSDVLAVRYERGLPTVITSGKTPGELTAQYGAAVVRRVREAGGPNRDTIVDLFPLPKQEGAHV